MEDFDFVWDDYPISSSQDIVNFENRYMERESEQFPFDDDPHYIEAKLALLTKGRFALFNHPNISPNSLFISAGLSELEALVLAVFLADLSGLFRKDAYHWGLPPVVNHLCDILDSGLRKLPKYTGQSLVRILHEYDKANLSIGEIFVPGYSLTASANPEWRVGTDNKYIISPKGEDTCAHDIHTVYAHADEMQVTFTQDASFVIDDIKNFGSYIEIFMHEQ